MHDVVIVGVPLLVTLAGIMFGRADYGRLDEKIDALRRDMTASFDKVNGRLDRVDDHLIQFHSITGKLDGRMDAVERTRN